jgi:hypothetical protein
MKAIIEEQILLDPGLRRGDGSWDGMEVYHGS